ncbi:TatD DNase family protein [Desulfitispora alkaliphila]|uniref:TatD family hydrolase n=1 Tax=Desulfitispora alkaliphila TaxID=622674 RepID=UPI003D244760
MLFDSHAHLDDGRFTNDIEEVVQKCVDKGVSKILNVGINLESSQKAIELAEQYPFIYASVGVHPHDAKHGTAEVLSRLEELASHPKVVAMGEMGLDFYHNHSTPEVQREVFIKQVRLAKKLGLPIIVHDRDAHNEVFEILEAEKDENLTGVFHCFSGSWEFAQQCLDLGFHISLAGPVTFANAKKPKEVAKNVPIDRLLIETDCPYLTPHPFRGKRNDPALVELVAKEIAALRGIELNEVASTTAANACKLFKIDK